jgi:hypothetical protein
MVLWERFGIEGGKRARRSLSTDKEDTGKFLSGDPKERDQRELGRQEELPQAARFHSPFQWQSDKTRWRTPWIND